MKYILFIALICVFCIAVAIRMPDATPSSRTVYLITNLNTGKVYETDEIFPGSYAAIRFTDSKTHLRTTLSDYTVEKK